MNPCAKVRPSTLARALRTWCKSSPTTPDQEPACVPLHLAPLPFPPVPFPPALPLPAVMPLAREREYIGGCRRGRTFNIVWVSANHGNGVSVTAAAGHVVKDEGTAVVVSAK